MAELTGSNLPFPGNFREQQAADMPCDASNQDAWPVDFIVTTGLCAHTLLGTLSYNTATQVDLIKIWPDGHYGLGIPSLGLPHRPVLFLFFPCRSTPSRSLCCRLGRGQED
jgi:hypothetical protein